MYFTWIPPRVTRQVLNVVDELLNLRSTHDYTHCFVSFVLLDLIFFAECFVHYCMSFVLFAIVLSVLLQFMDTDYPLRILKPFLDLFNPTWRTINIYSHFEYLIYTRTLSFEYFSFIFFYQCVCLYTRLLWNSQQNEIFYHFNIIMSLTSLYVYHIYILSLANEASCNKYLNEIILYCC